MINLDMIFLLVVLVLIVYAWFESLRIRELVIDHCKSLCRETDLQLLDQTVALVSFSVVRTSVCGLALKRRYQFEVSESGVDRMQGYVTLLGNRIVESRLEGTEGRSTFYQKRDPGRLH